MFRGLAREREKIIEHTFTSDQFVAANLAVLGGMEAGVTGVDAFGPQRQSRGTARHRSPESAPGKHTTYSDRVASDDGLITEGYGHVRIPQDGPSSNRSGVPFMGLRISGGLQRRSCGGMTGQTPSFLVVLDGDGSPLQHAIGGFVNNQRTNHAPEAIKTRGAQIRTG